MLIPHLTTSDPYESNENHSTGAKRHLLGGGEGIACNQYLIADAWAVASIIIIILCQFQRDTTEDGELARCHVDGRPKLAELSLPGRGQMGPLAVGWGEPMRVPFAAGRWRLWIGMSSIVVYRWLTAGQPGHEGASHGQEA